MEKSLKKILMFLDKNKFNLDDLYRVTTTEMLDVNGAPKTGVLKNGLITL